MLFLDFEQPRRLRVNGIARIADPTGEFDGAPLIVRVQAQAIFPNCPRYIHRMQLVEASVYAPPPGYRPLEPGWKQSFQDVLPER